VEVDTEDEEEEAPEAGALMGLFDNLSGEE